MGVFAVLLVFALLSGSLVTAQTQEEALLDTPVAKGLVSRSEALKVQSGGKGGEGYDQQALIGLLRAKGILDEKDLAQLQVPSPVVAAPAAPPPEPQDLTERVTRLEQEANHKPPFTTGYENGFFLRSTDGNFSMRVGGRASMHALYQQEDTSQNSTFFIDRARAYMDGVLYKYFQYKVEAELASSSILRDAHLNVNHDPRANVQIGQYKIPFSYEELLSKRYTDLVERSTVVLSTINPTRDIGLMLHGRIGED